ncbi:MAG TPA: DUF1858 domain-containing protein [bacterium]|nr:DUF1858 domain-containing protein [bacterium]
MKNKEFLTEETTVYEALTKHPVLKEALIGISPKYRNLQNPVLFNTVAKVTPLKKAAAIGGIYANEFLLKLNTAIGAQDEYLNHVKAQVPKLQEDFLKKQFGSPGKKDKPEWYEKTKSFDIIDVRDKGEPFALITSKAKELKAGEGFKMIQTFEPAPLMDYLKNEGVESYAEKEEDSKVSVYFYKKGREL